MTKHPYAHRYFQFILSELISKRRIWDGVSQQVLTAGMTQETQSFQQHNGNDTGRRVWERACIHQTGLGFGVAHQATGLVLWDKTVSVSHKNLRENDNLMKSSPSFRVDQLCRSFRLYRDLKQVKVHSILTSVVQLIDLFTTNSNNHNSIKYNSQFGHKQL